MSKLDDIQRFEVKNKFISTSLLQPDFIYPCIDTVIRQVFI